MKIGSRVVKVGLPGILGTVTGTQGRMVHVTWSEHFSQLVDPRKLIQVTHIEREEQTKCLTT